MTEQRKPDDKTPATDNKDGAWAGKRDAIQPEEQTDPPKGQSAATQAQDQQQKELDSGAELPA